MSGSANRIEQAGLDVAAAVHVLFEAHENLSDDAQLNLESATATHEYHVTITRYALAADEPSLEPCLITQSTREVAP